MKKNILKIFLKIIGILLVISLMVASFFAINQIQEFDFSLVLSDAMQNIGERIDDMMENTKVANITSVEFLNGNTDNSNLIGKMITINDTTAFLLNDAAVDVSKGDEVVFSAYASDQLMAVLISGYPNMSPEDVGLSSEVEFYQATQIALIEVASRTSEITSNFWENSRLDTIKNQWGAGVNSRVFAVAKKLIEQAEQNPFTYLPGVTIDNADIKAMSDDENGYMIFGTYSISTKEYAFNPQIVDVKVTDIDENEVDYKIIDIYENEIENLEFDQEFYIEIPIEISVNSFLIEFNVTQDKLVGQIYESDDKSYIALGKINVNSNITLRINFQGVADIITERIK